MRNLRLAFEFLTILPVGSGHRVPPTAAAQAWFPLVGLTLGGMLAGLDAAIRQWLPDFVTGAMLLAALLTMTRALHTEGFIDCCDGLFGGHTKQDRLRILRDTHAGSFAVIGGATLVILKVSLLASTFDQARVELLVLFPCLSRLAMVATMTLFPYARPQGLGTPFHEHRRTWHGSVALMTSVLAAGLLLGFGGLGLLAVALFVAVSLGRWMTGLLGGMTGDTYGAVNELVEIVVLALGVAMIPHHHDLFAAPLW